MIDNVLIGATRFLVGGHPEWIGCAPSPDQRIYVANHGSHLDTILIWAALPAELRKVTHPVAAADYWSKGALRRKVALGLLRAVLIERNPGRTDPLAPLKAVLEQGQSLVLFPEGTRGKEALPGPFKPGLFRLAREFPGVDLIPIYLRNLSRAFPRGAYLPVPISCHVRFGAPFRLEPGELRDPFLERARGAVAALA
jgi:1-acyl-sn-glycerol-3-phosphate acyltransferase